MQEVKIDNKCQSMKSCERQREKESYNGKSSFPFQLNASRFVLDTEKILTRDDVKDFFGLLG